MIAFRSPDRLREISLKFSHVRLVSVDVEQPVLGIVQALVAEDVAEGIFPELTSLGLNSPTPIHGEAIEQFVTTRRLSGRPVDVYIL